MSGHNGLAKYARVNREDEIINLKTIGASGSYGFYTPTVAALSATDLITHGGITLATATPGNLFFPTGTAWEAALIDAGMPIQPGSCVKISVLNEDPVNPKTLNFSGAGMASCDGSTIIVQECSYVELQVCARGPNDYVVFPMVSIVDPTQQDAWLNSIAEGETGDTNTITIVSPHEFRIRNGLNKYLAYQTYWSHVDADNKTFLMRTVNVGTGASGPYEQYTIAAVARTPNYNVATSGNRSLDLMSEPTTPTDLIIQSSIRTITEQGNYAKGMFGCRVEGRPFVTEADPAVPINAYAFQAAGNTIWSPLVASIASLHPDDPNTGWKIENYNSWLRQHADASEAPPPVAPTNGTLGTWSKFGTNNGISMYAAQRGVKPANCHFAPNQASYFLGCFSITNPRGIGLNATCLMDFSKNIQTGIMDGANALFWFGATLEIDLQVLENTVTNAGALYFQKYIMNAIQVSGGFIANRITQISATQTGAATPPSLTAVADCRPLARARFTTGPNTVATGRNFLVYAYVRRFDAGIVR